MSSFSILEWIKKTGEIISKETGVGSEIGRREAEMIIEDTLGMSRGEIYISNQRRLQFEEKWTAERLLKKRLFKMPIQYVLGHTDFYGFDFFVDERCFIPRPETETLIELVCKRFCKNSQIKILDLGSGSGAIGITLALLFPDAILCISDVSVDALEVAKKNAERYALLDRIHFIFGDLFESVREKFSIIVSNPPYIVISEFENLSYEIKWEPKIALDGGEDGMRYHRRIIKEATKFLIRGGLLVLEVGEGQAEYVEENMRNCGYRDVTASLDLLKIRRVISGWINF